MKPALLAASLVLVGASAVACGGGGADGAPTDASEQDFCESYRALFTDVSALEGSTDQELIAAIKDWGAAMQETGTPEGISDDGRAGFETTMSLIDDLDEDAKQSDFEKLDDDLTEDETAQVDEFDTYTTDTCGSLMDDVEPPELPSETTPETPEESPTQ